MMTGIYGIHNRVTGFWYVGQASCIESRKIQHFRLLEVGRHHNKKLQAAFKEHGAKNFEFHILEKVPLHMLNISEKDWMDFFQSCGNHGYNIRDGSQTSKTSPKPMTRLQCTRLRSEAFGKACAIQEKYIPHRDELNALIDAAGEECQREYAEIEKMYQASRSAYLRDGGQKPSTARTAGESEKVLFAGKILA